MKTNLVATLVVLLVNVSFVGAAALEPPYKYQFNPKYADWVAAGYTTNNNCGPACNAMVIGCFLGQNISTALYSSPQEAQEIECMTEARWLYCSANGLAGGYTNTDMGYNDSDEMIVVLNHVGLPTELVTGSDVTLEKVKEAIGQGCLVICHVDVNQYYPPVPPDYKPRAKSHWALAYGYDATSVLIHDPGYQSIRYKHITNSKFVNALENASGGNKEILILVSKYRQYSSGAIIAVDENNDGRLSDETLWLVQNSQRRKIPTLAVLESWNRSADEAVPVRPAELERYPIGADLLYRPGTIVRYGGTYHYLRPLASGELTRNDATLFALLNAGFHMEQFVSGQAEDSPVLSGISWGGSLIAPVPTTMPGTLVKGSCPEIYQLKLHADGNKYLWITFI